MFKLDNILTYTTMNIQILGIFIAIIGGLVVTKLLNIKIEKDSLKEKLTRLDKEIDYNNKRLDIRKDKIYQKNRRSFINEIYEDLPKNSFSIDDYETYDLTYKQRENIVEEVKVYFKSAVEIFKEEHDIEDVDQILIKNGIFQNLDEYDIYHYVGVETATVNRRPSWAPGFDFSAIKLSSKMSSLQENLEERDLTKSYESLNELQQWKLIEKRDIESKLYSIDKNLSLVSDLKIFILTTVFGIMIPQFILCIYPIFHKYAWLKYIFAIYSILSFLICMICMIVYIFSIYTKIKKDN